MTTMAAINEFLSCERIAIVGVSRNEKDFSRAVFQEFVARGYDVAPVNPNAVEIGGRTCFSDVGSIEPPVQGALIMTPATHSEDIVRACAHAGIKRIWLHRGAGLGSFSPAAVTLAEECGMTVVEGECPLMFLNDTGWIHSAHRVWKKVTGRHPLAAQALLSL